MLRLNCQNHLNRVREAENTSRYPIYLSDKEESSKSTTVVKKKVE
jgi:hypothetical protein